MTPEFGAPSQLEKIDMLDFADVVAINKFDRRGGEDALRDVRRQMARNREDFTTDPADLPVFGTVAAHFNDGGVTTLYRWLGSALVERGLRGARAVWVPSRPAPGRRTRPSCPRRGSGTWPTSPTPCAVTTPRPLLRRVSPVVASS